MRIRDIERQARVAFQTSQVDKEADWEQAHLPKEKRTKRPAKEPVFTSTSEDDGEEEREEPPKKKVKQPKKGKGKKSDKKEEDEQ